MTTPSVFRVQSLVLLPFRDNVAEGRSEFVFGTDSELTVVELSYKESFALPGMPNEVPTPQCTWLVLDFPHVFHGDQDAFKEWLNANSAHVVNEKVLPRVNHFLAGIQFHEPGLGFQHTSALRNVGEIDLLFHTVGFAGETLRSRASPTFYVGLIDIEAVGVPPTIESHLAPEWLLLTRAVHLVNYGFLTEAVLVAFALLDTKVQEFLMPRFPNLSSDQGEELLRAVESRRLKRYLGLMMRVCVGESPLDDRQTDADVAWLNGLRNHLMHRAESCSMKDAQRALRIVKGLLDFLNTHGAGLEVPKTLKFWTPDQADAIGATPEA